MRARRPWLAVPLLLLAACGAAPAATTGGPDDAAAPVTPAVAPPDAASATRAVTCVSPRRSFPVVKATGALVGDALVGLTISLQASGGVLVAAPAAVAAPGLDGGSWTARYGFQPWALGAGYGADYFALLPASPIGEAFGAYYLAVSASGAKALKPLSCSAPWPVAPVTPTFGPTGPAVRSFACKSLLVRSTVAVTVAGGLDAGGQPRDVRVTRVATGAVESQAVTPAYLDGFDGGSWVSGAGLYAWSLDAAPDLSHVLLLPPAPGAAFEGMALTDYGASGRVEVPLTCTAG